MALKNYYQVLGVGPAASSEEIKKVYRSLAKQYHPDRNGGDPGSEERLKEINEAYQVLGRETTRKAYDLMTKSQKGPAWPFVSNEAEIWAAVFRMFDADEVPTWGAFCPRGRFGKGGCGRRGGRRFKNNSF